MTLAGWSCRKMPLRVPQEPIITEQKNGGVTTPAPLAVPDQDATVRTNPITGEFERAWRRGSKYEPVQNEGVLRSAGCPRRGWGLLRNQALCEVDARPL